MEYREYRDVMFKRIKEILNDAADIESAVENLAEYLRVEVAADLALSRSVMCLQRDREEDE